MVLMNVLIGSEKVPGELREYDTPHINICSGISQVKTDKPTLIYGKKLAKEIFGDSVGHDTKINQYYYWSYSEQEIPHECWVDKFVKKTLDEFFRCTDVSLDLMFDKLDPLEFFLQKTKKIFIHNGRYEIYLCIDDSGKLTIFSMKKDSLVYLGMDPDKLVVDLINGCGKSCMIFSNEDVDIKSCKVIPIVLQDACQALCGKILTMDSIHKQFESQRNLSKQEILVYIVKKFGSFEKIFQNFLYKS